MRARFGGKCPECGGEIKAGKEIVRTSRDPWVHKACSDTADELP